MFYQGLKRADDLVIKCATWREGTADVPSERIRIRSSHDSLEKRRSLQTEIYNKGCNKIKSHSQDWEKDMKHLF